jgi:membrane associated rhomboid family serine protease
MSNVRFTRPDNFPPVVKNLIIINVLVYIAQNILDSRINLTNKFTLQPIISDKLKEILGSDPNAVLPHFQPYQIFTHMFTHAPLSQSPFHILFNMLVLWMFGRVLESVWGAKKFLTFYLICGVGAAAFHLLIQYFRSEMLLQALLNDDIAGIRKHAGALTGVIGASGAIMGVMAAFALLFPNTELYIWGAIPIKAKWAVLGYVAYDLFAGVGIEDNIAHFAHLGGAITGFIIVLIWNKTNRRTLY